MNGTTNEIQNFKILFGKRFLGISTPIITLIGVVLNPLSFYIYSKPAFNRAPAVVYLKALCVLDTLNLLQSLTFSAASFGYDPKSVNAGACKLLWYTGYVTGVSSSTLESFISIDRCLSIKFVNRFKILTDLLNSFIVPFTFMFVSSIITIRLDV